MRLSAAEHLRWGSKLLWDQQRWIVGLALAAYRPHLGLNQADVHPGIPQRTVR